jgi:hypothetical protein
MAEWRWYEAFPPRGISPAEVTAVVRVLAGRPRFGMLGLHPLVTFELWLHSNRVRWLIGMDQRLSPTLPGELRAQCPDLALVALDEPERPTLLTGRELRFRSLSYPVRTDTAEGVTAALLRIRTDLRTDESVAVQWIIGPVQVRTDYPVPVTPLDLLGFTTPPEPDVIDQQAWRHKLAEPLFGIRGRTGAVAANPRRAASLTRPVYTALALANDRHGRVQVSAPSARIAAQLGKVMGRTRTWSGVVNAAELAVLIGWNLGDVEIPGRPGRFGPPPTALLQKPQRSAATRTRRLGTSTYPAARNAQVELPFASYAAHLHVIGPPGVGKSTLLANWVLDEAKAGRSVVVIEPKGDLVADVLARLPKRRHDDLVVIDAGAEADLPVVGVNPLAGPLAEAEQRADSLLHLFRELFGSAVGARSADVLLHALILAARLPDGALTDVLPLLTMPKFRQRVVGQVGDPLVIGPWVAWFDSLSDAERGQVVAPIANKIRVFTSRPAVRRLLGQAEPKFRLDSVFDTPRVVLVNLNAGAVGPNTASLVGSLLLNQFWHAIQRQTTKPAVQRRPVAVFLDEWQTVTAGLDFADVLARARGAKVPFTVAHQHLDQLTPNLKAAVLANARSRVAFRPAEGDARALAAVLGKPVTPDELDRLAAYHAVARVLVDAAPSTAFEVATPPLSPPTNDPDKLRRISAERFGIDSAVLDDALMRRWQGEQPPDAPIGLRRKRS